MAITLVVNPGSSSKKYALYEGDRAIHSWRFERTGHGFESCVQIAGGQQTCNALPADDFTHAADTVAKTVRSWSIEETKVVSAVVVRVVAPGTFFQQHQPITDAFIRALRSREVTAPLHIPMMVREIESLRVAFPHIPLIAASDSAFHSTLPPVARTFSIHADTARELDIYRFGYHGLSVASVLRRVHSVTGQNPSRVIVCHIGSGCSVTAVLDGRSVDTTMGFAPGSGLIMGSRAGDIDTGALLALMRARALKPIDAERFLQQEGGLFGLARETDIRILLDRAAASEPSASDALAHFSYIIKQAIARMIVPLGGLDALVLTATAVERSAVLRTHILTRMESFGIIVQAERNDALVGKDGVISAKQSPVKVAVIRTDEMGYMAHVAQQLLTNEAKVVS
jgi:acetate kinase